ncbi:solute carrier family 22 member 7-like [Salarias fasciatus]|uniref:solute carrier family 22 member 7-like n=1 Tax=Salarias fasciatus TaxID=181472 RepID=UPI0011769114|nr:solute carrier family 22 member 7-like [Salarias fasciatus]
MKFDNVLSEINGFGTFQFRIMLLLIFGRMCLPFNFLLNNFIAVVPSHHCNIDSLDDGSVFRNLSVADRLIVSIPLEQDGSPNPCEMFAEPQYHLLLNFSSTNALPTVSCKNGWIFDNSTFKSTIASEWDLVCDKKKINRAIATVFFIGVMIGAVISGYLSDRFGRKRAILLCYITTTIFGFASAFSYNFMLFAAMRFFTGVGLSGISIISYVICLEWVDIKHRTAAGILMSLDWSIFTAVIPLLAYFLTDWRHLTAAVTAPQLVALICWRFLPESARWLISNGNCNLAHSYLRKCAQVNKRQEFMAEISPQVLSKVILVEDESKKYSYADLLRTPNMRKLAVLTGIVWFAVASTYYGISLNVSGFGVNIYLTQFIFGIIEIPAKAIVYFSVDKIGRRLVQAGMVLLTGLCLCCSMFIPRDNGSFQTAVGALGKMFSEAAFTTLYLYSTELYPTVLRQNGLGYCSFLGRLGVSICPLILLLEDSWAHLPNMVFFLVALAGGVSASFLRETKNTRLPETIDDVEQTSGRSINTPDEQPPPL